MIAAHLPWVDVPPDAAPYVPTPRTGDVEKRDRFRGLLERYGPCSWERTQQLFRIAGYGNKSSMQQFLPRLTGTGGWADLCEDDAGRLGFTWQEWD